jgi:hypothetical protein
VWDLLITVVAAALAGPLSAWLLGLRDYCLLLLVVLWLLLHLSCRVLCARCCSWVLGPQVHALLLLLLLVCDLLVLLADVCRASSIMMGVLCSTVLLHLGCTATLTACM